MVTPRVLHPPAPEDAEAARRIESAAAAHDGHESLSSFIERDLLHPTIASIGVLATGGDEPVGYGHLAPSDTTGDPHLVGAIVVDPAHRAPNNVAPALPPAPRATTAVPPALPAALGPAGRTAGAERIVLWMNGVDDAADAVVRAAG